MADNTDKTDELYPIAVLIDELKVHEKFHPTQDERLIDGSTTMFSYDSMQFTDCPQLRWHWELSGQGMS